MMTQTLPLQRRKPRLLTNLITAICLAGTIVCVGVEPAEAEVTSADSQSVAERSAQAAQTLEQKVINLYEAGADHEAKGRYSAARLSYEEIFALFESEDLEQLRGIASRTPALESAITSLVEIYWAEGASEKAAAVYSTIIPLRVDGEGVIGDFGTKEEHESLAVSYSEERTGALIAQSIAQSIDSADEDTALVQRAFSTALVKKSRVLDAIAFTASSISENISPQIQSELDTLYRELANLRLAANADQPNQVDNPDITALEDQITAINIELLRKDSEALQWLILPPPDSSQLEEIQESVPADAALIEIIEYATADASNTRRYAAYALTRQGGVRVADLGDAAEINSQVAAFRQALQTQSARAKTISQQLDRQIMQPIRSLLEKDESIAHLLISPDSHLNTIPFEAFVDETDRYLVESYQISYVTSGKDLFKFGDVNNGYRLPFVIVADPDYDTSSLRVRQGTQRAIATAATNRRSIDFETLSFTDLPGTLREATLIENLIPEAIFLTQDEPTENIIKQIRKPFILHFATHGFFLSDRTQSESNIDNRNASFEVISTEDTPQAIATDIENPLLRAGLALTGANNPSNDGEDGILTALEVSEMDLHGTELVVLSACETGLGAVSSGEGIYGMRRAFTMAGAASQVLSLWQVDDTGTSELMSLFYENLTQKRQGRSEALRNAQIDMLNTGTYAHPYYWSAFILSGNWRPLATEEELELEQQMEQRSEQQPERDHRMRLTTANFNLAEQIEEYKESRAWRDEMLAEMLALGDQRRYEELAEKREEFNQIMDSRTNPDLFRLSITLLENLNERMKDLYLQERYAEAIAVVETMIDIQANETEAIGRFELMQSWSTLAFLQQAQGADDITMLMTYGQMLSAYEDLNK